MKAVTNEGRAAKAAVDSARNFSSPTSVVEDENLSREEKIEILRCWEYDAREMQVADEEGFPARKSGHLLDDVLAALHRLGTGPDIEHSPPTKQGGV